MELNNGEIWMARQPLAKLMEQKFPVMVSYRLAKMANKLNEQLKIIEDTRSALVRTHGEPDKANPKQMSVPQGSKGFDKFMDEFAELMNQEIEVKFDKVKLPEKVGGTCDSCNHNMDRMLEIEPSALMILDKFVEV